MNRLIILRGNSGSGKTTTATALRTQLANTLLVSQDVVRRDMLAEKDKPGNPTIELIETIGRFGLQHQRTVILEGILSAARYGDMLKTLIAEADQSLVYYYDLSFDETLRRHAHRAKAKEFGADVMRDWYLPHDRLNVPTEQLISADWSQTMVINHILTDLAGLNNTESVKPIH